MIPPEPSQEVGIHTELAARREDLYVIVDEPHPTTGLVYVQGAREAARQPDLGRRGSSSCSVRWSRCGPMRASSGGSSRDSPLRDVVILVVVLLAAAVVVLVALPFLREPVPPTTGSTRRTDADERRLALVEERDRALAALKELEFDHRTGKVDDADYRELVGPLRQAAAVALRALDPPQE